MSRAVDPGGRHLRVKKQMNLASAELAAGLRDKRHTQRTNALPQALPKARQFATVLWKKLVRLVEIPKAHCGEPASPFAISLFKLLGLLEKLWVQILNRQDCDLVRVPSSEPSEQRNHNAIKNRS